LSRLQGLEATITGEIAVKNDPNIQRWNRGNMPANQQAHMGPSLVAPTTPVKTTPAITEVQVTPAATSLVTTVPDPEDRARIKQLEERIKVLQASQAEETRAAEEVGRLLLSAKAQLLAMKAEVDLSAADEQTLKVALAKAEAQVKELQATKDQVESPDVALQAELVKVQEERQKQVDELLEQTVLVETLTKKVKDLEDLLAEPPKTLDTPAPLDRVWVTTVHSRSVDNGNVVVACTMHQGQESARVTGTILIPQSEFGKLRPQKQQ
jgi:hypothetical protein